VTLTITITGALFIVNKTEVIASRKQQKLVRSKVSEIVWDIHTQRAMDVAD